MVELVEIESDGGGFSSDQVKVDPSRRRQEVHMQSRRITGAAAGANVVRFSLCGALASHILLSSVQKFQIKGAPPWSSPRMEGGMYKTNKIYSLASSY